jgi:GPH family glycoside/pentoside/hexuronide:cation symporter
MKFQRVTIMCFALLSAAGCSVQQTQTALGGIRMMMSIFPAVPFFIGVAILFFYEIDKHTELQMTEELIERRKKYEYD